MPLYEYECESCSKRFERIQKFSDPLADTCPSCGGPVRKLLSSPAIQFKGSGFYITDYGKKGSDGGSAKKETSDTSSTKDSGGTSTTSSSSSPSSSPSKTKPD